MEGSSNFNHVVVEPFSPPQEIGRGIEDIEMGILFKAISDNNWLEAQEFIDRYPIVLDVEFGASRGETPLHVAARFGHVGIVEALVRRVDPEYLKIYDASGYTPLIIAAEHSRVIQIATCLINKNNNALRIPIRGYGWKVPVYVAFHACLKEMGRYLYEETPPQLFTENRALGIRFLRTCIVTGELDIALNLLRGYKELLFAVDVNNFATIDMIADHLPDSSFDKSQLSFWKRWVYDYIKIPSTTTIGRYQDGENNEAHQGLGLLLHRLIIFSINNFSGMKEIGKMKQQHAQAAEIVKLVCENVMFLNEEKKKWTSYALIVAARKEKIEFLLQVTRANPELVSLVTFRQSYGHVFFDAVRRRRVEIFNLLHSFRFKHVVATTMSEYDIDLLYAAASLGPTPYLNKISGAALQMQRELQWFKAVESMVDPAYRNLLVEVRLNSFELFKENHEELRKEGEKWLKAAASSCLVVGILIVTVMFAVALAVTLPGGNNQASGYPIFLENKLFKVFLISDALSLFSATTSVLTFLGILMSRYAEEDFLYSLPRKLIIGLSTLLLSFATMMVAFSVIIAIMMQHNFSSLRVFLPIAMFGGVPISLCVLTIPSC